MKWEGQEQSENVEDRRGANGGSGGGRMPRIGGRGIGLGSIAFKAGRPRAQQALAFGAALLTVVYIVAVAISRSASLGLA